MSKKHSRGYTTLLILAALAASVTACLAHADAQSGPTLWKIPEEPTFADVSPDPDQTQDAIALYQPYFDQFSWQTFVALNWPATENGEPDTGKWIGADVKDISVWEHWMNADDLFPGSGKEPAPWGRMYVPFACGPVKPDKDGTIPSGQYLIFTSDDDSIETRLATTDSLQVEGNGPLVDQNKVWARFEAYVDHEAYNYIIKEHLYTADGQRAFKESGKRIHFPANSMELKAVWKVIGKGDNALDYHTRDAVFFDNKAKTCQTAKVGLVAMHILARTSLMPNGVWATFDRAANQCQLIPPRHKARPENVAAPSGSKPAVAQEQEGQAWSSGAFCSAQCMTNPGGQDCTPNKRPPQPWRPPVDPTSPSNTPKTQVVRNKPIPNSSLQSGSSFKYLLQQINPSGVWKNYELIGTQWVLSLRPDMNTAATQSHFIPSFAGVAPQYTPRLTPQIKESKCNESYSLSLECPGLVTPVILANPMIETYAQNGSSCFGCHQQAHTSFNQSADFSWLLSRVGKTTNP